MSDQTAAATDPAGRILVTIAVRDQTLDMLTKLSYLGFGKRSTDNMDEPGDPREIASLWLYRWTTGRFEARVTEIVEGPRVALDVPVEPITHEKITNDPRRRGESMAQLCALIVDQYAASLAYTKQVGFRGLP